MALVGSNSSSGKELNETQHRIMGHLHHGALKILSETIKEVLELGTEHEDVCKGCMLGKYAKETFLRSDKKVDGVLDLLHSDIFGSMSTRSLCGAENFITFIDDHSKKTWIYFLKTKDEVFD